MLQAMPLFIRLLHVIFFYILFVAQDFSFAKTLRVEKFLKLFFSMGILLIIQFVIKIFLARYLQAFCTIAVTVLFLVVATYLCLRQHRSSNLRLKINILLAAINFIVIQFFCAFLDNSLVVLCRSFGRYQIILMLIFHNIIEGVLALIVGIISGKIYNISQTNDEKFNNQVLKIMAGNFIIMYAAMTVYMFVRQLHDYIENFLFLFLIQLFIFWLLYFSISWYKSQQVHSKLVNEQLDNLKKYTEFLEKEQRKLRKFKHDYQNLLLSLEENLKSTSSNNADKYVQTFKEYCDNYINDENSLWIFNDFDNIKTPYLKSILINKTFQAVEQKIKVHFECRSDIVQIAMEPYDLVRIVGILYDNAIEAVAALDQDHRLINVMIYKSDDQIEITISNPILESSDLAVMKQEGVTSKKGHSGFGMTNVEEIINNYSNVLANYQEKDGNFTVQFIIMNKTLDQE